VHRAQKLIQECGWKDGGQKAALATKNYSPELTSGKLIVLPPEPPEKGQQISGTVLAVKDSLRRQELRPCPLRAVPPDLTYVRAAPADSTWITFYE
jgi:hypothetical protein